MFKWLRKIPEILTIIEEIYSLLIELRVQIQTQNKQLDSVRNSLNEANKKVEELTKK